MALQSESGQLGAAWRALDQRASGQGWQLIDICSAANCSVMAGRKGPGNEESLVVGILRASIEETRLPRGQGFLVTRTEIQTEKSDWVWLALVRQQSGQIPIFTLMAADVVACLRKIGSDPGPRIYSQLIARIRSWQRFMSQEQPHLLTPEEEVGLVGELLVLRNILSGGFPSWEALEAWVGPDDGLHDFVIGSGGIEAKATVAPAGFIAKIASLEQLDNSLYQPLYLGTVRLAQSESGKRLPEIIDELAQTLNDPGAATVLARKLASAGYLEVMRDNYNRRFECRELAFRLVDEGSPRLTRSGVPAQVLDARYTLDLDAFPVVASDFREIAERLGVSTQWN